MTSRFTRISVDRRVGLSWYSERTYSRSIEAFRVLLLFSFPLIKSTNPAFVQVRSFAVALTAKPNSRWGFILHCVQKNIQFCFLASQLQISTKLKISHWYFDQCLYSIKTSSVKNILSRRFSTYFITQTHLMRCLTSLVNLIAVMTLLLMSGLHRCWQRIFKKNTNYFMLLEWAFH